MATIQKCTTILVQLFSTMARAEENYKVTSTSLALLMRQCDHKETMASLFWLGDDSKTALVTGSLLRKCKHLHQIHRAL